MQKLEELLREVVANGPCPIVVLSAEGTLLYANGAAGPILSFSGMKVHGPAPADWKELIGLCLSSQTSETHEIATPEKAWQLIFSPWPSKEKVTIYGIDVTHEKSLEAELVESIRKDAVSAMIGTYNHQINNPLTIALTCLGEDYAKFNEKKFNKVLGALQRLTDVTRLIGQLSRDPLQFEQYSAGSRMVTINNKKTD